MDKKLQELLQQLNQFVDMGEEDAKNNPSTDEIQIVVVEPNKKPYKHVIKNELKAMQKVVGGWIEVISIGKTERGISLALVVHEEGKLIGLPINRKTSRDTLVGTFFIQGVNMKGEEIGLTDEEAEELIEKFTPFHVNL